MFSAYYLLKDRHEVTVIDNIPTDERSPTSSYNAGLIVPSTGASPPIGMGTILSPYIGRSGPVYISLLEVMRNMRWFRIGLRKGLEGYESALTELGANSLSLYNRFFEEENVQVDRINGILGLYKDKEQAESTSKKHGGRFVESDEIEKMGFKNFGGGSMMDEEILSTRSSSSTRCEG